MARQTGWLGVKFPFSFSNGKLNMSKAIIEENDYSLINESIKQVIGTFKAERQISNHIGLPNRLIFKNFNEELIPYYENIIEESVALGEKRIAVKSVTVDSSEIKEGILRISVYWSLLNSDVPNVTEDYINLNGGE